MSSKRAGQKTGAKITQVPRGAQLREYLAKVTADLERFEQSLHSLPRVDSKGGSDCPTAEDHYARKEELEAHFSSTAPTLRSYLEALNQEVKRCANNLSKVRAGTGGVATPNVVEALDSAAKKAEDAAYHAATDRDAVALVLPRVEAALKVSRTKKYPGKAPQRQAFPGPPSPQVFPGSEPVLGRELEGVLSLGPLPREP